MLATKWSEHYENLSRAMKEIKEDMTSSQKTQIRIESCLRGEVLKRKPVSCSVAEHSGHDSGEDEECDGQSSRSSGAQPTPRMVRESLMEV